MPLDPPVMTATLPSSFPMASPFVVSYCASVPIWGRTSARHCHGPSVIEQSFAMDSRMARHHLSPSMRIRTRSTQLPPGKTCADRSSLDLRAISVKTAGHSDDFACDPCRICRGQKGYGRRDVARLANSAKRSVRDPLFCLAAIEEPLDRVHALGLRDSRIDGIDANVAWTELLRHRLRHRIHRRLGGAVNRRVRRSLAARPRTDVDDAASRRAEMPCGLLGSEDQSENIQVKVFVEMLFGDIFER